MYRKSWQVIGKDEQGITRFRDRRTFRRKRDAEEEAVHLNHTQPHNFPPLGSKPIGSRSESKGLILGSATKVMLEDELKLHIYETVEKRRFPHLMMPPAKKFRPVVVEHSDLYGSGYDGYEEDEEQFEEYDALSSTLDYLAEAAKPKKSPEQIAAEKEDLRLAGLDRDNITPEQQAELADIKRKADTWLAQNPDMPVTAAHHYINKRAFFPAGTNTKELIGKHFDAVNPKLDYKNEAHRQQAADVLTHDVMHGFSKNSSAHGWYDRTVDKTLDKIAQAAPEIKKNPEDELAFKLAVAICSQNQEVHPNFESGYLAYRYWKQHNQMFPVDASVFGGGTKSPAMIGNFKKINDLWHGSKEPGAETKPLGAEGVRQILEHKMTVAELKQKYGVKIGGESPDYPVEGAALLGPKIGSFFNNLNKRFHTTTFDMWASRNLNRLSGSMLKFSPSSMFKDTPAKFNKRTGQMGKPKFGQLTRLEQLLESGEIQGPEAEQMKQEVQALRGLKTVTRDKVMQVAPTIANWAYQEHKRYAKGSPEFVDKKTGKPRSYPEELKSAATSLAKNIDLNLTELADAPKGPVQRKQWRDIFDRVKANLSKAGIETNQANLQALLWFSEQKLFQLAGSRKKANADYLDAAHRVVRKIQSGELPGLEQPSGTMAGPQPPPPQTPAPAPGLPQ
jgi:hypothetical protein